MGFALVDVVIVAALLDTVDVVTIVEVLEVVLAEVTVPPLGYPVIPE